MCTRNIYQQFWKEWAGWCAQEGAPNNAVSAPKLAAFYLIYLWLDLLDVLLVFIILLFFLEPHHHHKASSHHTISKLMHHFFFLQHPPTNKSFDPGAVAHLLSMLQIRMWSHFSLISK